MGTFHFALPSHQAIVDRLAPVIAEADALLVELGPKEEAALKAAMLADPTLIVSPSGPTLPERLEVDDWDTLAAAMAERGVPAVVASRMRPWYVAMLLGTSPCMMAQMARDGSANGLIGG